MLFRSKKTCQTRGEKDSKSVEQHGGDRPRRCEQGLFQGVSSSHQGAKVLEFQLQPQSSNEYSELNSFRINWFDLLAVQGVLKSLLQHHSSKTSILWCSAFFMVQLSHPYMINEKIIALTIWTFVGKVMSLLFNTLPKFVIA